MRDMVGRQGLLWRAVIWRIREWLLK
jgi:hypothetical protein